jgi:hypothetical protein
MISRVVEPLGGSGIGAPARALSLALTMSCHRALAVYRPAVRFIAEIVH